MREHRLDSVRLGVDDVSVSGRAWNTHGREMSGGRFPLQVEQAVANPVARLDPQVTTVTVHARYYTLHGLLAYQANEDNLTVPEAQNLLRRCEVVMGAASLVDEAPEARLYGKPHSYAAMQQVSAGGDLDVDEVSRAKPTRPAPGDSGDRISVPNASSGSSPQEHLEAMKALRPERRSACARVLGAADTTRYTSAAALSLVTTALTVAGYQRVLPREVAMPSAINPSAIA